MCERRRVRWSACLILTLLSVPGIARAQAPTVDRAALVERIHRLDSELLVAQAAAARSDQRAAEIQRGEKQDTVAVGPLHIVTAHSQADEARRLWGQVWSDVEPTVGARVAEVDAQSETLRSGPRFWFTYDRSPRTHRYFTTNIGRDVSLHTPVSDEHVREVIKSTIGSVVTVSLPQDLWRWGGIIPYGEAIRPDVLYREFVRAPAALAQRCVSGAIRDCWTALGEMDPSADVVDTWYPPEEQRALILATSPGGRVGFFPCEDPTKGAKLCADNVRARVARNQWPFSPTVRSSLLWFAIERGGPGALERLVASVEADDSAAAEPAGTAGEMHGSITHIREHLGRAANMDPDALLALWREQVLAGRPGSSSPDAPTRTNVLVWMTLLGACATRSTRWRLG